MFFQKMNLKKKNKFRKMNRDILVLDFMKMLVELFHEIVKGGNKIIEKYERDLTHEIVLQNRKISSHTLENRRTSEILEFIKSDKPFHDFDNENERTAIMAIKKFSDAYKRDFLPTRRNNRQKLPVRGTDLYTQFQQLQKKTKYEIDEFSDPFAVNIWNLIWKDLKRKI